MVPTWLMQQRSPMVFCSRVVARIVFVLTWRMLRTVFA